MLFTDSHDGVMKNTPRKNILIKRLGDEEKKENLTGWGWARWQQTR
jgi:hypothetical protein